MDDIRDQRDQDRTDVWSRPLEGLLRRIQWRFVAISWLVAAAVAIAVTSAASWIVLSRTDDVAQTTAGVVQIIAVTVTFLTFFLTMFIRLQGIPHDRLLNAVSVGALHAVVAFVAGMLGLTLRATQAYTLPVGSRYDELGLIFLAAERSAPAALLACAIAAAIMPARGPVPEHTQRARLPTDRQL